MMDTTAGTLLGGQITYHQPRHGYRTGLEPVLLAAAIPARPGERVLEAGTGAGAGLLCLARRVPGLTLHGIEIDPAMAQLARANLARNGLPATVLTADVTAAGLRRRFHHAFANPPWHDPASTRPPDARRALATHGMPIPEAQPGLERWATGLARAVLPGGTLTLVVGAPLAGLAAAALSGFAVVDIVPFWPKQGQRPKIVILQAHGGSGPGPLAGLVLHEADGRFTAAAEAVLRRGAALPREGQPMPRADGAGATAVHARPPS